MKHLRKNNDKDLRRRKNYVGFGVHSWSVPSIFKRVRKRIRKAKEREAFRKGDDDPNFKQTNNWDFW